MFDSFITKLTGVSYGDTQENIKQFGCSDTGYYILIREPDNEHDANAISVSLCGIWHMGYIPKTLAAKLAPLIDEGKNFDAEFVDINSHPAKPLLGITVKIVERKDMK